MAAANKTTSGCYWSRCNCTHSGHRIIIVGYWFDWTGFNGYNKVTITHTISGTNAGTVTKTEEYQPGKGLWDWLQLLGVLAIPVVVGFGAVWFTTRQGKVADAENKDNQREATLQAYLDKMSEFLLLKENSRVSEIEQEVRRKIAKVQTLTVLPRLDGRRKGNVLQFLYEADLINKDKPIIDLYGADLRGANLSDAFLYGVRLYHVDLSGANLSGASLGYIPLHLYPDEELEDLEPANLVRANLSGANLSRADLNEVDLSYAILIGVNLNGAGIERANLYDVDLSRADLSHANLLEANLRNANLSEANLYGADLTGTDLSFANLKGVTGINEEELKKWAITKWATMPDRSKYKPDESIHE